MGKQEPNDELKRLPNSYHDLGSRPNADSVDDQRTSLRNCFGFTPMLRAALSSKSSNRSCDYICIILTNEETIDHPA